MYKKKDIFTAPLKMSKISTKVENGKKYFDQL